MHLTGFFKKNELYISIALFVVVIFFIGKFVPENNFDKLAGYLSEMPYMLWEMVLITFCAYFSGTVLWLLCIREQSGNINFAGLFPLKHVCETLTVCNSTEILCITHKYPPCIGGMEKQSYELIAGLGRYYKMHVIAYRNNTSKVLWFLQLRSRITEVLKENPGIKLIHLNDGSMGVACLWLLNRINLPVIVTFHGLDVTLPSSVFQRLLIPKMTNYSGAICVSKFTTNEVFRRGFSEKTTFTVRNGVDTDMDKIPINKNYPQLIRDKYGIDLSGKRILFTTGRPVKRKGFSWFIKNVMPLLSEDIVLLMVGSLNTEQNIFQKTIHYLTRIISPALQLTLGLDSDANSIRKEILKSKNTYHLGRVPNEDLIQLLSLADLFIMPNIKVPGDEEGFGLVALEANMRGTFVLASGIEGITDAVIDGENGYHLPAGNIRAWADTIHEVLRDKSRLDMLSIKAKEYVKKNYSWDIMVKEYKEIFDKYINI